MENQKSRNLNNIAMVLAAVAFVLALSAVLVKYFRSGEFDITALLAGIVIPGVVFVLARSRNLEGS